MVDNKTYLEDDFFAASIGLERPPGSPGVLSQSGKERYHHKPLEVDDLVDAKCPNKDCESEAISSDANPVSRMSGS